MTAAMTEPGQRVVFGKDGHARPARLLATQLGLEGGGHARGAHLDRNSGASQQARQASRRLDLLVSDLGMGMNPVGGFDQLRRASVDRLADPILQPLQLVIHYESGYGI